MNVCLCQVRICQKVYVIAGMSLLALVLGGLCLFASVKELRSHSHLSPIDSLN